LLLKHGSSVGPPVPSAGRMLNQDLQALLEASATDAKRFKNKYDPVGAVPQDVLNRLGTRKRRHKRRLRSVNDDGSSVGSLDSFESLASTRNATVGSIMPLARRRPGPGTRERLRQELQRQLEVAIAQPSTGLDRNYELEPLARPPLASVEQLLNPAPELALTPDAPKAPKLAPLPLRAAPAPEVHLPSSIGRDDLQRSLDGMDLEGLSHGGFNPHQEGSSEVDSAIFSTANTGYDNLVVSANMMLKACSSNSLGSHARRAEAREELEEIRKAVREVSAKYVNGIRKRMINDTQRQLREESQENWLLRRKRGITGGFTCQQKRKLRKWFDSLDDDGSGEISAEELRDPLISFGLAKTEEDVIRIITDTDTDGSGEIGFAEFLQALRGQNRVRGPPKAQNTLKPLPLTKRQKRGKERKQKKKKKDHAMARLQEAQDSAVLGMDSLLAMERRRIVFDKITREAIDLSRQNAELSLKESECRKKRDFDGAKCLAQERKELEKKQRSQDAFLETLSKCIEKSKDDLEKTKAERTVREFDADYAVDGAVEQLEEFRIASQLLSRGDAGDDASIGSVDSDISFAT